MSRYGDTPVGMVESALEFVRIARGESYHNIVLSMKASNPQVMVQAYRLLIQQMDEEFGECYPLHLGVTEAGDGEDGRVKSAVGIGTLLEDGIGDTIRVSLTEDPEYEIPVCHNLVKRYKYVNQILSASPFPEIEEPSYNPFAYKRRETFEVTNIGGKQTPVVIADFSKIENITPQHLESIGYKYDATTDKWNISDSAADYVFIGIGYLPFALPGTLKVISYLEPLETYLEKAKYVRMYTVDDYINTKVRNKLINFVQLDCANFQTFINNFKDLNRIVDDPTVVFFLSSKSNKGILDFRRVLFEFKNRKIHNPVILNIESDWQTADEHLIQYAAESGALFLDGLGDGIFLTMTDESYRALLEGTQDTKGRNYSNNRSVEQFINSTAFNILQATRLRVSKTEYISCPSCGRTLFDLQETTGRIRRITNHLKGIKIAIMGCIVNGPGEMADADFGYVGSGIGKITLYKGKEIMKRNIDSEIAVNELITLLKESDAWVESS